MKLDKKLEGALAILLGNGLNNYSKLNRSWLSLLEELSKGKNARELLESGGISYPEYFDALCLNEGAEESRYRSLKPKIKAIIKEWKGDRPHRDLLDFARKYEIPILTTNYDTTLLDEDLIRANRRITKRKKSEMLAPIKGGSRGFTDFYPWSCYYSDRPIKDRLREFGIWHMHGFWFYERSLSIGSLDYAANIARMRELITKKGAGLYDAKTEWLGKDSWLDILMHQNTLIVGLSLGVQETSLRWLLMQRERYYRRFPELRKTCIYVQVPRDKNLGKEYLFASLGISLLELEDYGEIYGRWEFA